MYILLLYHHHEFCNSCCCVCCHMERHLETIYIRRHIQFARNPTRSGTSSKLVHVKALQSLHHHFYFNRIVRLWNHLPEIDTSLSIHTIKNQITAYLWNHFITSFNSDSLCSYHVICPCYRCSRQPVSVNFFRLTDT